VANYLKVRAHKLSHCALIFLHRKQNDLRTTTDSYSTVAEDNMNVQLKDITATARDGRVSHLDQVYIRGSHVRFIIVPDMLRNAPMFRSRGTRGRGVGLARGRATVNRARAGRRN
jgi:hypothetical protein